MSYEIGMSRLALVWIGGLLAVLPLLAWRAPCPAGETVLQDGIGVMESVGCARCHSNAPGAKAMRDAAGRELAPYDLWRSTMMANAARDPLWRAAVSVEVAATPAQQVAIESKCMRCHAPMADALGLDDHGTGSLLHALDCDSELGDYARDGVSCTVCHGITPEGLGTEASFTGGFTLDAQRRMFGPHEDPFPNPMRAQTTFTPTQSDHILSAQLCGACHTLYTGTLDAAGNATGHQFLEQSPYLEWRNSIFSTEGEKPGMMAKDCQGCHVPTKDVDGKRIETVIARNPAGRDFPATEPRSPFGRHVFVGGNTLVLSILRDHADELRVTAPRSAFDATIAAAKEQLSKKTASLTIEKVERAGGELAFEVKAYNRTGHKLPTGHPTRRAWLQVVVRDASGAVVFASGVPDEAGRILGSNGQPLPFEFVGGPIEPHRDVVSSQNEVAIYQAVMAGVDGAPTHLLMRGATWLQDTRLLPLGWKADHAEAARTSPIGVGDDSDFSGGSDRVHYRVRATGDGPYTIEAALLYQPLSARWAAELFAWDTPEVAAFRRMYAQADKTPAVLASATSKTTE